MTEETAQVPGKKGGCMKAAGIGCLVVLLAAGIGGFYVAKNYKRIGLTIASKGTVVAAESLLGNMQLPDSEREAAMVPIREFAARVGKGEVTMKQLEVIGKVLTEGPLPMLVMARAAEVKYLQPSDLPEEEKKAGSVTLSRFAWGMTEKKIDTEKLNSVFDRISVKTTGANGQENVRLKEKLSSDDLRDWLKTMKDAADEAGVEDRQFDVNIAAEIRKAIDAGLTGEE